MFTPALLSLAILTQQDQVIPFHLAQDAIIVEASVNGRDLSLMLDTGFAGDVIVENTIDLGPPTGQMSLRDFVGEFDAKTVKLKSLRIGSVNVDPTDMEAVLQPPSHSSFIYNAHTDGVLGFGALSAHIVEINFQKKQLIFHPKSFDISKRAADGKSTFLTKLLPLGHTAVVMQVSTTDGQDLNMSLDTGNSFYATTYREVLQRINLWPSDREPQYVKSATVASGEVDSWVKKMPQMNIFGVPVPVSYWDVIQLPASTAENDGTVGIGFLQNFNITIDYERRRVLLENFTGKVSNDAEGETGILAAYDRNRKAVRVAKIQAGSPAALAGIRRNDTLLSVNGNEIIGAPTIRQIEQLLTGKVGSKVRLGVSREGQFMRFELERAALVND